MSLLHDNHFYFSSLWMISLRCLIKKKLSWRCLDKPPVSMSKPLRKLSANPTDSIFSNFLGKFTWRTHRKTASKIFVNFSILHNLYNWLRYQLHNYVMTGMLPGVTLVAVKSLVNWTMAIWLKLEMEQSPMMLALIFCETVPCYFCLRGFARTIYQWCPLLSVTEGPLTKVCPFSLFIPTD